MYLYGSIISNKALPSEYDKEALKDRYDYLSNIVENFDYICKKWFNLGDLPFNFALSEETPFLLKYSTYNSVYGLILNANCPSKAFEDDDLD